MKTFNLFKAPTNFEHKCKHGDIIEGDCLSCGEHFKYKVNLSWREQYAYYIRVRCFDCWHKQQTKIISNKLKGRRIGR